MTYYNYQTDYVRYFTRQTLDSVFKKLKLTLNRPFDWQTDTKICQGTLKVELTTFMTDAVII